MQSVLEQIQFFKGCDLSEFELLAQEAVLRSYHKNELLIYEEDDLTKVYFLIKGEVKVYKVDRFNHEVFLYTLQAPDLITNIGSFESDEVSCFGNIEFLSDSTVALLDLKTFKQSVIKNNLLLSRLINLLSHQHQIVQCSINMGMIYDATAKVARMLVDHLKIYNQLKKQEIAYRLNIQPATLSRVLSKFTRLNLISESDQKTLIHDIETLKRYYKEAL